jgi:BlaI family transcriptional regulator, penicillinase repressor
MARTPSKQPTDGELEILNVLWDAGPSSLGDVCEALQKNRAVAKTTVATVLGVMLEKKLVQRARGERGYLWSAKVDRKTAASGMVGKLVDHVFNGSAKRLVAHLLDGRRLSEKDREELRKLLDSHRKS